MSLSEFLIESIGSRRTGKYGTIHIGSYIRDVEDYLVSSGVKECIGSFDTAIFWSIRTKKPYFSYDSIGLGNVEMVIAFLSRAYHLNFDNRSELESVTWYNMSSSKKGDSAVLLKQLEQDIKNYEKNGNISF